MKRLVGILIGLSVGITPPPSVRAAALVIPSDFRPVAVEGTARAAWVNPSGIGSAGMQSLVLDGIWGGDVVDGTRRLSGGAKGISDLAYLSVAASTGRTAYAFRYEFDDVDGVADWTVLAANRVVRNSGTEVGTAIEWRGGESQSLDATVSMVRRMGTGLRMSFVVQDVFAQKVDGMEGARRYRFGTAYRPPIGLGYVSWDFDRVEDADEGQHWFALGIDRARLLRLTWATNADGEWSVRAGLLLDTTLFSGGVVDSNSKSRDILGSLEWSDLPIVD
ncbi:MAG: hypothetical protein DHS20C21_22020 [Gemmatimonadota bacterium]|nr:MAG: hypothetical protein DHS20C21_22020 [Gemmatimonadota bacterium]